MIRNRSIILLISSLLASFFLVSCVDNKTYFDTEWNQTTKGKAAFYRLTPKKENGNWQIRDFYISGEKQFIGQAKDSLGTVLEGDVIWYFKTGKVESRLRYESGKVVAQFTVVEGAIGSKEEGWDEKDTYYYDQLDQPADAQAVSVSHESYIADAAHSQRTDVYEYYYTETSAVAGQHTNHEGYDDKLSFTLFFNKEGKEIGRLDYNKESEKWKGKEVVFHQIGKASRNEVSTIKEINIYDNGMLKHTQSYNENEELITEGSFKNGAPHTGTFIKEACWFHKIQEYKKGSLRKEITFDYNDNKIGEITFKNEKPITGVLCNCASLENYKNGKLDGTSIKYLYEGIGEELEEKNNFNFKNDIKHGDYFIKDHDGVLLEKGSYENGRQSGELWYYHGAAYYEDGDTDNSYYLKTTVQSTNNKSFITELSQFNLEDDKLLHTFKFEQNTSDKFTYLDNGYHAIYLKDFNSDGFDDLQIWYSHHAQNITSNTFYIFNSATGKYQHLPDLDLADDIEINTAEKTIKTTIIDRPEIQTSFITYGFSNNKLIKKLATEEVHHNEKDTTFLTQVFPLSLSNFPLLNNNLPPITFIQENNEHQITEAHQTLTLKKAPFSVQLPGLINEAFPKDFTVKIIASYNENVFEKAKVNQREEDTDILGFATTFARHPSSLIIDESGNNAFYYDDTEYATLDYIKNINEEVLLLQFNIDKIDDVNEEKTFSELNKPIYMIIYMDKNLNKKIDYNEIFYVAIEV